MRISIDLVDDFGEIISNRQYQIETDEKGELNKNHLRERIDLEKEVGDMLYYFNKDKK